MFINDLKPNQSIDTITLEITSKGEVKEFNNFRGKMKVANAKVKDETGQCTLTLWNDDADRYSAGQKIRITNGWCKEYREEVQISSGKYGKIEVLKDGEPVVVIEDGEKKKPKKSEKKARAKKTTKAKKDELEEEDAPINVEDELFPEAKKDVYVKYQDKYGKEIL